MLLVDKARFPRDKCCGDGLTTGALRQLERLGLDPSNVASWTSAERVHVRSPGAVQVKLDLPRERGEYAVIAPRVELDAALVALARSCGAKVRDGNAVTKATESGQAHVRLTLDAGSTITASHVIAADGVWSPMRKLLSAPTTYLGEWHAFRQYHTNVGPKAQQDLWIWFEPDIAPGYVWSFPLPGGRANVGFGIERRPGVPTSTMNKLWPELLARPHIRQVLGPQAQPTESPRAWPIPCAVGSAPLAIGRTLFVGDAARVGDLLTGEGIGQALETGTAAAQALIEHRHLGADSVRQAYEQSIGRTLRPDHRMAALLQGWLHHNWVTDLSLRTAGLNSWTRANFARWLFEDEARGVLLTPSRLHRRFLARDGAFASEASREQAPV